MRTEPAVRALKKQEFLYGKAPDGGLIGRYRDYDYADLKHLTNPLAGFGNVDLIMTGAFVNSAYLVHLGDGVFTVGFDDPKEGKLVQKYGTDINGLNQQTFNKHQRDNVAPHFIKEIKKRL